MQSMPKPLVLLFVLVATASAFGQGPNRLGPGDHTRTLTVGGLKRSYLAHIPPTYASKKPTPVVLAFHGGGGNAETMVVFSGLNKFTRQLLDDLAQSANIDPKRVFATGMSNGGIMSYLLASELSDRIAAIAPVGGPMGTDTCKPMRPVSVIHFHGTDDEHAPFQGGKGKGVSGTEFYSVEHSVHAWVRANGCAKVPVVTKLSDTAKDGTTITRKTYDNGKNGAEVVLIEIEGGGHTWPGQEPRLRTLGKSTKNISANDLMWEFFEKHPLR